MLGVFPSKNSLEKFRPCLPQIEIYVDLLCSLTSGGRARTGKEAADMRGSSEELEVNDLRCVWPGEQRNGRREPSDNDRALKGMVIKEALAEPITSRN
jgi:hypothetical protein